MKYKVITPPPMVEAILKFLWLTVLFLYIPVFPFLVVMDYIALYQAYIIYGGIYLGLFLITVAASLYSNVPDSKRESTLDWIKRYKKNNQQDP